MKLIFRYRILILLVLFFVAPFIVRAESASYKIASVKAYLFYNHSGSFSENVIDNPDFVFWNAIIGEGSAKEPSDAVFVDVEIEGPPGSYESRNIQLEVSEAGQAVLKKSLDIGILSDEGSYHAGFWLYETGCAPVKLIVKILGQDEEEKIVKEIPFACGE